MFRGTPHSKVIHRERKHTDSVKADACTLHHIWCVGVCWMFYSLASTRTQTCWWSIIILLTKTNTWLHPRTFWVIFAVGKKTVTFILIKRSQFKQKMLQSSAFVWKKGQFICGRQPESKSGKWSASSQQRFTRVLWWIFDYSVYIQIICVEKIVIGSEQMRLEQSKGHSWVASGAWLQYKPWKQDIIQAQNLVSEKSWTFLSSTKISIYTPVTLRWRSS